MKTIQLISATLLLAAAGGAFAGTDDGASNSPWQSASMQAPAPAAAAMPATSPQIDTRTQVVRP